MLLSATPRHMYHAFNFAWTLLLNHNAQPHAVSWPCGVYSCNLDEWLSIGLVETVITSAMLDFHSIVDWELHLTKLRVSRISSAPVNHVNRYRQQIVKLKCRSCVYQDQTVSILWVYCIRSHHTVWSYTPSELSSRLWLTVQGGRHRSSRSDQGVV